MKRISLLFAVLILASCHNFDKDVEVGNIRVSFNKELMAMKKKTIDSMNVVCSKMPKQRINSADGWYSSSEMKLPPGVIVGFEPETLTDGNRGGPYYIMMKGFDGKRSINKVDKEKWLLLQKGDVIK